MSPKRARSPSTTVVIRCWTNSIGLADRIFTRVGADDALHRGHSTFMVEMTETANILNHISGRSLVILDEIGRGTSTLDGLSLAWAIAEHLARERRSDRCAPEAERGSEDAASQGAAAGPEHASSDAPRLRRPPASPRTLFATHYHELTELEEQLPGKVANLQVAVREWTTPDGHHEIIFLHRIVPGRADQSYGLHVAKLAGLPRDVIERAREILGSLSVQREREPPPPIPSRRVEPPGGQLSLFTEYLEHPAVAQLRELKLDRVSPLDAFDILRRLQTSATGGA
jgi:DNA mismatch repair protein MutS